MKRHGNNILTAATCLVGATLLSACAGDLTKQYPEAYTAWQPMTEARFASLLQDKEDADGNVVPFQGQTLEWRGGSRVVHWAPDGRRVDWTGRQVTPEGQDAPVWETIKRSENRWYVSKDGSYCTETIVPPAKDAKNADGTPADPEVRRECGLRARSVTRLDKIRFLNHHGSMAFEATLIDGNPRQL